ncbi:hypothetical protein [Burkholderia cenocepacia]|nr:hypothetical protein [Burkholderia cenocepacia]
MKAPVDEMLVTDIAGHDQYGMTDDAMRRKIFSLLQRRRRTRARDIWRTP